MNEDSVKGKVNFIFELGHLKRETHSGFALGGVKNPGSVAEHSFRAAQIGFLLAEMENEKAGEGIVSAEKVVTIMMIHDNAEARVRDQHKVASRYYEVKEGEKEAFKDQVEGLGSRIQEKWNLYFLEYKRRKTKEGVIAKDADWLETAFQAKEYLDLGYDSMEDWILNVENAVETESAKDMIKVMKDTKFTDWWKSLKKMTYEKLDNNKA